MIIRLASTAALLTLLTAFAYSADPPPAISTPAHDKPAPSGPISVAIMEPEILGNLPAEDRKAIANSIDALLTENLGQQKNLVLVDRQTLDKILTEKASKLALTKLTPQEVAAELRPFWSAGILICPVVRQATTSTQTPGKPPALSIEIDAVLAQTGQSLGEIQILANWQDSKWEKPPALSAPLNALSSELPEHLRQALSSRYLEIADVRLTSRLRRLQWMTDDIADSLRASLAQPGVSLLRPRHPASTKEERLLRVMGLSSPSAKDPTTSLACIPHFRLDAELTEEVGKDLDYAKTPITLTLTLQGPDGKPIKKTLSDKAAQYATLSQQAATWLNQQLAANRSPTSEAQDQQYSRQLAQHELDAARQLVKECSWYDNIPYEASPENLLRTRVLAHALRASHLDPTSEEAARLTVFGIDSPYCARGDGRSSVCADRVIAEGQRYLDRHAKSPNADKVRHHLSSVAFQQLTEMRQHGDGEWISLPYNLDIWRYAKVYVSAIAGDIHDRIDMNLWADANVVGACILGHCPPDQLEQERTTWRAYWKKNIEPLKGDLPPWEFVELNYFIRQKDCPGLRNELSELARRYPRSHEYIWWGTRPYPEHNDIAPNAPCWKVRVYNFLKLCGDRDAKTWEPDFGAETFTWNIHEFQSFAGKLNPAMPPAWDTSDGLPLPASKITIDVPGPALPAWKHHIFRPLFSSGGYLWFCEPPLGPEERDRQNLWVVPLKDLQAREKDFHVTGQSIPWPDGPAPTPSDPAQVIHSWTQTFEGDVPTVWIGTNHRGLARYELKDGKWSGRYYAAKQGVPGEDILSVRPCLHQGKPKLLILSQPREPRANNFDRFLWVLDPATGQITTILTSKTWDTVWYKYNVKLPEYWALVAVWKDHTKVPLNLYDRQSFPKLDVADITSLENGGHGFTLARNETTESIWQFSPAGLVQFDAQSPTQLLAAPPIEPDLFFYASPDHHGHFAVAMSGSCNWRLLQAPMLDMECTSGPPAVAWGKVEGTMLLTAYRPASKKPYAENDAWYGPWKLESPLQAMEFIDGHLWISAYGGELYRINPSQTLAEAQKQSAVHSTAQWYPEYLERLRSSWLNATRMHLALKRYDQALAAIAAERKKPSASTRPAAVDRAMDLFEALTLARKGDLAAADRAYLQLADNAKAEPFFRGLALMGLANVRLSAKDLPGMNQAMDRLVAFFPGLNAPDHFSEAETIQWYRDQAKQNSTATRPAPK